MYNKFFGLAEAPFNITPDSRFLYLSQRHREALSALLYGIKERKGFILLTGEIGAGKTTICRALVHELKQENVKLALILNPGLNEIELLKAINDEFQIPSFYDTKKGLIDQLNRFLIAEHQAGNNVVLIIDEAQNLEPSLLEQIRILSNLETESDKLLQIVLMGQPELNDTLRLSQLEQLNQRIAVRFHITPLSNETEMLAYVRHRLFVARAKIEIEFTDSSLKLAFQATRGIPRKINVLCDRVLLACYVEGTYTVTERVMQTAIDEVAGDRETSTGPRLTVSWNERYRLFPWKHIGFAAGGAFLLCGLVAGSVFAGMQAARWKSDDAPLPQPRSRIAQASPTPKGSALRNGSAATTSTAATTASTHAKAVPTATPDWESIRKRNPNWQYDKNAPLVRVNNPRAAKRAAQFSLLRMWGLQVELSEVAKLGEDLILNGAFKSEKYRIHEVTMPGSYYDIVRLNVPVIVKLKDSGPDRSEYVVLLQCEGDTVKVGDPVWGVKIYQREDLIKRWDGATALFTDANQLANLQKGDRNERVRGLQQYLKQQGYIDEVSGVFDVKTTDAVRKLQDYYKLKDGRGQMDALTLMILNSRMMREGPRLTETE